MSEVNDNPGSDNIALGPGKEFDIVRSLLAEWKGAERIGDDAQSYRSPMVRSSSSALIPAGSVPLPGDWLDHFEIGYRANAASPVISRLWPRGRWGS